MAATAPRTSANGLARPAAALVLGAVVPVAVEVPVAEPSVAVDSSVLVVVVAVNVGETMVVLRSMVVPVPVEMEPIGVVVVAMMDEFNADETDEMMDEMADDADEAEELADSLEDDAEAEMDDEAEGEPPPATEI